MSRNLISDTVESLARGALAEERFLAAAEQLAAYTWFESVRQTSAGATCGSSRPSGSWS